MRKQCERPGCSAPAAVSYGMDHSRLLVWMDNRAESDREMTGKLCARHADALVMPRGWTIEDRRSPVPMLFAPKHLVDTSEPTQRPAGDSTTSRIRRPKAVASESVRSLFDEIAAERSGEQVGDEASGRSNSIPTRGAVARVDGIREGARHEIQPETSPGLNSDGDSDDVETRAMPWTPRLAAAGAGGVADSPTDVQKMGRLLGRAYGVGRHSTDERDQ